MNFDVKCIRGPYWLPEEDSDADEVFAYECSLNGGKIIVGEEPADRFRYIHEADKKVYDVYSKNKIKIMPLIKKAIEAHELKQNLSNETAKTFEDIIDEL
jgi:hypothetical protein